MIYAGIGSRETPERIMVEMRNIATKLSEMGHTLRSGGARGADTAFVEGDHNAEVYLPWSGYNDVKNPTLVSPSPDAIEMAKTYHPAWHRCGTGARKMHGRNMHILFGHDLDTPVDFVVCWTKDGKDTGGTGQAIRAAEANGIPVFNLFREGAMEELERFVFGGGETADNVLFVW